MILVVLGTQDKEFRRLLELVDKEIEDGNIKEKVIVQAGCTKYETKNMEMFDLIAAPEFEKLMDKADLVITHGGAGTILTAIKKEKKIIACARLAKYGEHHNDHQKQIINEFVKEGYILELDESVKLEELLKKIKNFKPKKFESNTKNMIKLIENYIDDSNHISWYNKFRKIIFIVLFFIVVIIFKMIVF